MWAWIAALALSPGLKGELDWERVPLVSAVTGILYDWIGLVMNLVVGFVLILVFTAAAAALCKVIFELKLSWLISAPAAEVISVL